MHDLGELDRQTLQHASLRCEWSVPRTSHSPLYDQDSGGTALSRAQVAKFLEDEAQLFEDRCRPSRVPGVELFSSES